MRVLALLLTIASMPADASVVGDARAEVIMWPNDAGSWQYLGDVYAGKGKKKKAAEAYREALRLDPDNYGAREGLVSVAKLRVKRHQRRVLRNPEDDELWGDLADRYLAGGDDETALELYQRAASIDPGDSEWRGRIVELGGVELVYDQLLEEGYANANDETLGDAGDALWQAGRYEDACAAFEEASIIDPADSEWQSALQRCGNMGVYGYSGFVSEGFDSSSIDGLAGMLEAYGEADLSEGAVEYDSGYSDSGLLGLLAAGNPQGIDDSWGEGAGVVGLGGVEIGIVQSEDWEEYGVEGGVIGGMIGGLEDLGYEYAEDVYEDGGGYGIRGTGSGYGLGYSGIVDLGEYAEVEVQEPEYDEYLEYQAVLGYAEPVRAPSQPSVGTTEVDRLCTVARGRLMAGDLQGARSAYVKALQLDPTSDAAARGLVMIDGRPRSEVLDELELDGRTGAELAAARAELLLDAGDVQGALAEYEKAREADPDNVRWQEQIVLLRSAVEGHVDTAP